MDRLFNLDEVDSENSIYEKMQLEEAKKNFEALPSNSSDVFNTKIEEDKSLLDSIFPLVSFVFE